MGGKIDGSSLIGRKMRRWWANGTTLPANGAETLTTKVLFSSSLNQMQALSHFNDANEGFATN